MSLNSQKILGITITTSRKETILEEIKKYLFHTSVSGSVTPKKSITPLCIVTPNPEQLVFATKSAEFARILNQADVAVPDGIGIIWAAQMTGQKSRSGRNTQRVTRTPGVEFMDDLAGIAAKEGVRIGLIGSYGDLAVQALERLRHKYPKLAGWAESGPLLSGDYERAIDSLNAEFWKRLTEKIVKSGVRIVFIGFGAPKQEFFQTRLREELMKAKINHPIVLMAVGGSFDILSGKLKRAPLLIRSIGFEWFWRLVQEPWRWRRQLALLQFIRLVLRQNVRTG